MRVFGVRGARVGHATALLIVATCFVSPAGWTANTHRFSASYTGTGTGAVSGTTASGSATLAGRGKPIGPSTLTGSGQGTFTSPTCVVFSGKATLKGRSGSIRVSVQGAKACATGSNANEVSFSGQAKVLGGRSAFAHARGSLSFTGAYDRSTNAVRISFKGRITY
jgi:hypothetical protein